MQGGDASGLVLWLAVFGGYAWTIRSLARLARTDAEPPRVPAGSPSGTQQRPHLIWASGGRQR